MDRKSWIRLCHVCCKLSEADAEVLKCVHCGKAFLPVNYFENLRRRAIQTGQLPQSSPEIPLNPLNGLLVLW